MKTSCLRLKLVELNFFASFNADNQRKICASNVSKYTSKSSRWTFSIDNLKSIETYGEIWKHFETHNFENTLKHMIRKHFETYGEIWKQFETHNLKTIETYGEIWKPLKTMEIW